MNVVEIVDDVQDVVDAVVEDGLVREKADLDECGCRRNTRFDVELDVQNVVDVLEVDNVEHDVFEERGMLCGMVVNVEDLENNAEVVDEVDDVQDEIVAAKLVEMRVRIEM